MEAFQNFLSGDMIFLIMGNVLFLIVVIKHLTFMKESRGRNVLFKSIDANKLRWYLIRTVGWTIMLAAFPFVAFLLNFHVNYPILFYVILGVLVAGLFVVMTSSNAFFITENKICYTWPSFDKYDDETYLDTIEPIGGGMNRMTVKNVLRHTTNERTSKKLYVHDRDVKKFRRRFPESDSLAGKDDTFQPKETASNE